MRSISPCADDSIAVVTGFHLLNTLGEINSSNALSESFFLLQKHSNFHQCNERNYFLRPSLHHILLSAEISEFFHWCCGRNYIFRGSSLQYSSCLQKHSMNKYIYRPATYAYLSLNRFPWRFFTINAGVREKFIDIMLKKWVTIFFFDTILVKICTNYPWTNFRECETWLK